MKIANGYCLGVIAGLMFLFSGVGYTFAAQDQIKIATISIQDVLAKSKAGQEGQAVLDAKMSGYQAKFKQEQDDLDSLRDEIEKKSSVWTSDVLEAKKRDYDKRVRALRLKTDDAQYELKQLEKKVMEPILKVLHEVIADVGKKEGYTLVLENTMKGLRSRVGLLYADPGLDISDMVTKELDARMAEAAKTEEK